MMAPARVHHVEDGPAGGAPAGGAPLVFAPSLGSTLAMWDGQVPALAAGRRVIRFDLRGHGGSPAPPGPYEIADLGRDIVALLDGLAIERADLCGISIGGMGALWVAAHAPERVRRLILCCTSARLGPPEGWAARAILVQREGMSAVADAVAGRWVTPAYAAAHPTRSAELRAMVASVHPAGYAEWCGAIERMDLRPELGDVRAPTLVIGGGEDPAIPLADLRDLEAGIAGARLAIVPGGAHLPNLERGAEVDRLILWHLDEIDRTAAPGGGRP
jgi:3-oxoadipate enol-lactonase